MSLGLTKTSRPMNENHDPKLREVLGTWQVSPPPEPRFKSAVWQRITAEEKRSANGWWATVRDWLFVQLPKPAYASALLALTVVTSVTTANLHASHKREQYRLDAARLYLASIDPLTMSATAARISR